MTTTNAELTIHERQTVPVHVCLDADIVERFLKTGPDWGRRINAALRDWLKTHSPHEIQL
ncbi:BrnA antitoxin family protein [Paraburkholderia susongensis]|uniref:BrnA antitoxin family protein n=1 Tax=Paraburkholderia susongensis TaxID=1515439 RepID=UPI000A1C8C1E|nr:BrnA antitoxin family protein [Paraburkholderia susongensis]